MCKTVKYLISSSSGKKSAGIMSTADLAGVMIRQFGGKDGSHRVQRNKVVTAVLAWFVAGLVCAGSSFAQLSCSDVSYGNPEYHEKMDQLAEQAGLPDNYWNRYHESFVSDLCGNNGKNLDQFVDDGSVSPRDAREIARVLGKAYKPKQRSAAGKSYGDSKKKFLEMGACSACADNIANYYTQKPDSRCGKLAKQALEGKPEAVRKLAEFPEYCRWK